MGRPYQKIYSFFEKKKITNKIWITQENYCYLIPSVFSVQELCTSGMFVGKMFNYKQRNT